MANLFSVPSSHSVRVFYNDLGETLKSNGVAFKAAPRDKDGALIDLTGYTTGSLMYLTPDSPTGTASGISCVLSGGGATGVDVAITDANASGIFDDHVGSLNWSLIVTNATNYVLAAIGTFSGQKVALTQS